MLTRSGRNRKFDCIRRELCGKQQPAYYLFEPGNVHLFCDCKDNGYIYFYGAECDTLNARTNVVTDFPEFYASSTCFITI